MALKITTIALLLCGAQLVLALLMGALFPFPFVLNTAIVAASFMAVLAGAVKFQYWLTLRKQREGHLRLPDLWDSLVFNIGVRATVFVAYAMFNTCIGMWLGAPVFVNMPLIAVFLAPTIYFVTVQLLHQGARWFVDFLDCLARQCGFASQPAPPKPVPPNTPSLWTWLQTGFPHLISFPKELSALLREASLHGKVRLVKHLLAIGANPEATDEFGRNALHYALNREVDFPKTSLEIATLLLKKNPSLTSAEDCDKRLPLFYTLKEIPLPIHNPPREDRESQEEIVGRHRYTDALGIGRIDPLQPQHHPFSKALFTMILKKTPLNKLVEDINIGLLDNSPLGAALLLYNYTEKEFPESRDPIIVAQANALKAKATYVMRTILIRLHEYKHLRNFNNWNRFFHPAMLKDTFPQEAFPQLNYVFTQPEADTAQHAYEQTEAAVPIVQSRKNNTGDFKDVPRPLYHHIVSFLGNFRVKHELGIDHTARKAVDTVLTARQRPAP